MSKIVPYSLVKQTIGQIKIELQNYAGKTKHQTPEKLAVEKYTLKSRLSVLDNLQKLAREVEYFGGIDRLIKLAKKGQNLEQTTLFEESI